MLKIKSPKKCNKKNLSIQDGGGVFIDIDK